MEAGKGTDILDLRHEAVRDQLQPVLQELRRSKAQEYLCVSSYEYVVQELLHLFSIILKLLA